jgi:phage/plasmid-like protein (TIGR03299 family)
MPHEVESMAYAGSVPWHGLGTRVKGLMTAREALVAAGLDWEVELAHVYIESHGARQGVRRVDDWKAIQRVTDKKVYAIVGARYEPIQNKNAFNFFDEVVGSGQAIYETAGALQEGRRIWILANMKGSIGIRGDEVKKYITPHQFP